MQKRRIPGVGSRYPTGTRVHTRAGTHDNYVRLMVCAILPSTPQSISPGICRAPFESRPPLSLTPHDRFCETVDIRWETTAVSDFRSITPQIVTASYTPRGVKKIDVWYRWKKKSVYIDVTRTYKLLVFPAIISLYVNSIRTHLSRSISFMTHIFRIKKFHELKRVPFRPD